MWWKIYFWVILVLTVVGMFGLLQNAPLAFIDVIDLVWSIFLLIGIYAYVYKKKIFSADAWKGIFYISILFLIISFLDLYILPKGFMEDTLPFLKSNIPSDDSNSILFAWVLLLPAVYVVYQLGFNKSKKK